MSSYIERLQKALKDVRAINGSPDIIKSLEDAIAQAEKQQNNDNITK